MTRSILLVLVMVAAILCGVNILRADDSSKKPETKPPTKNRPAGKNGSLEEALKRAVTLGKKHAAKNETKIVRATAFVTDSLDVNAYLVVVEFPTMVGLFQGGFEDDEADMWIVVESDQYACIKDAMIRAVK